MRGQGALCVVAAGPAVSNTNERHLPSRGTMATSAQRTRPDDREQPRGCEVLIVEDDDLIREELAEMFREKGYSVDTAVNGKDALDRLENSGPAGVVLLDLMMPIMNGWDFASTVRRRTHLAS